MMNSGKILSGSPCLGSWVNLRPGQRERKPARLRRDARSDRRADQRGQELVERLHAGHLPGDRAPLERRADPRPEPARGHDRADRARLCSIDLREQQRRPPGPREPTTPTWPRGSPATSWPSRCSSTRPKRSISRQETAETLELYGIDQPRTADFGRNCLLARRLVERGVRFVQLYSGGAHNDDNWDAHGDLVKNHTYHAGDTDKPIAGLIKDLKQRGLLDETLIVWGGEFGRQPTAEYAKGTGRDHNAYRLHDVDGRRRHQGGHQRRRDRRARQRPPSRTASTSSICTPPILQPAGPRPQPAFLLLRRPGPEAGRRRGGRADPADHLNGQPDP